MKTYPYYRLATYCPRTLTYRDNSARHRTPESARAAALANGPGTYRVSSVTPGCIATGEPFTVAQCPVFVGKYNTFRCTKGAGHPGECCYTPPTPAHRVSPTPLLKWAESIEVQRAEIAESATGETAAALEQLGAALSILVETELEKMQTRRVYTPTATRPMSGRPH